MANAAAKATDTATGEAKVRAHPLPPTQSSSKCQSRLRDCSVQVQRPASTLRTKQQIADNGKTHEQWERPASSAITVYTSWPQSKVQSNVQALVSAPANFDQDPKREVTLETALLAPPGIYSPQDRLQNSAIASAVGTKGGQAGQPGKESLPESINLLACKVVTGEDVDALVAAHPLPPIKGPETWNRARYAGLSLYRRLMLIVVLLNGIAIAATMAARRHVPALCTYRGAASATGANLLVVALMRQEHVINLLFRMVCGLPHMTPLSIRRTAAKVAYSNGGIHSGAGGSAFLWYIVYAVLLVDDFEGTDSEAVAMSALTAATVVLFTSIIGMSHPSLRSKYHDYWELCHRYCGYTAVALVWAQAVILAIAATRGSKVSISSTLIVSPSFWFLATISCCLIYPWLWLRRLPVDAHRLSDHATELRFYNRKVPVCTGTRLSHVPWRENHSFATIADSEGGKKYSVIVASAGDWTKKLIADPPTHIWQRGAPTTGVMRVAAMFKPVVIVATGAGIGPCLSFLSLYPDHPKRVVWSARSPCATYQPQMIVDVLRADKDAVIIDTKKSGHPDLPAIAYALVQKIGAEAVMVISNPRVTRDVVYQMEARRIPAFGPIFDS